MQGWWERLGTLSPDQAAPLQQRWNDWLIDKYETTDGLRNVWDANVRADGVQVFKANDFTEQRHLWDVQDVGAGDSSIDVDGKTLTWAAKRPGADPWSLQLHRYSIPVEDGSTYTLRLRIRRTAGDAATLKIRLMHMQDPWQDVAAQTEVGLTDAWQDVVISLAVTNPNDVPVRLSFDLDNEAATLEMSSLSLGQGDVRGVAADASLEEATVSMPLPGGSHRALADFRRFCTGLELAYTEEMVQFLRKDLGVEALIFDTQLNYGGAVGLVRERTFSDVNDLLGYPAHPADIMKPGGERTWQVIPKLFVGEGFNDLPWSAQWQAPDLPMFLTEYDLNPPSPYSSEIFLMLALFGPYQDFDALGEYAWLNFQESYEPDTGSHPYHTSGMMQQVAFAPTAALLYRQARVRTAEQSATLTVYADDMLEGDIGWSPLEPVWKSLGFDVDQGWRQKLVTQLEPGTGTPSVEGEPVTGDAAHVVSDTGEISFDRSKPRAEYLTVDTPSCKLAIGHTLGVDLDWGDVDVVVHHGGGPDGNYANASLISLDDEPINESRSLLLTVVATGYGEGWDFLDEGLTQVRMLPGPMRMEPVDLMLSLPRDGWKLTPLDPNGQPLKSIADETASDDQSRFNTGGHSTVWFHLTR